jgi:hypothetical protein
VFEMVWLITGVLLFYNSMCLRTYSVKFLIFEICPDLF